MTRFFHPLRGHRSTLLLACLLILGQVFFELQLPGYMTSLVNIGIQSRGIEHAAPERLTSEDASLVVPFMSQTEQAFVKDAYQPLDSSILQRRELTDAELETLDRAFVLAEWTILDLLPEAVNAGRAAKSAAITDLSDINLSIIKQEVPDAADLSSETLAEARKHAEDVPMQLARQTGAAFAAAFDTDAGIDVSVLEQAYVRERGAAMAFCAAAASIFSFLSIYAAARTGAGVAKSLRRALFLRVAKFTRSDFLHFSHASLLARSTTDVTLVQTTMVSAIRVIVLAFCMGIGGVILAALQEPTLAWILLSAVGIMSSALIFIYRRTRPRYNTVQNMIDRLDAVTEEAITGAATIRVYGAEQREEARFDQANDHLAVTQLGINRLLIFLSPIFGLTINLVGLVIVWLGADAVQNAFLQIGNIIADIQYAGIVLTSYVLIAGMFVIVPRAGVALERIQEVLDWPDNPGTEASITGIVDPVLDAAQVSFRYPGAPESALENVTFTVHPGQTVAFLGRTGSGKTTLLDVLSGALKPDAGTVFLQNRDVHTLPQAALDACLSFLPQERGQLLQGPFGTPAAKAPVYASKLRESVMQQPACLYLLDDVFEGIRPAAFDRIWKEIETAAHAGSVILTGSRVSNVKRADIIYVLENGHIIASGTHEELLASCPLYQKMSRAEGTDI